MATAVVAGTITASTNETDITTKSMTITLTGDTWIAAAAGYTPAEVEGGGVADVSVFVFASTQYMATRFQAASTDARIKVGLWLKTVGSPTACNLYASIQTDAAGPLPSGTMVGDESDAVASSVVTSSYAEVPFTGFSASLTSGTYYWVVVRASAVTGDGTNYFHWDRGTYNAAKYVDKSSGGTTWANQANGAGHFQLYK